MREEVALKINLPESRVQVRILQLMQECLNLKMKPSKIRRHLYEQRGAL